MDQHLAGTKHKTAKHWQRAATDAPKVSEVRSRDLEREILKNRRDRTKLLKISLPGLPRYMDCDGRDNIKYRMSC